MSGHSVCYGVQYHYVLNVVICVMACNTVVYWALYGRLDRCRNCNMIVKTVKLTVTREEIRVALEKLYRLPVEDFTIIPSRPSVTGLRCREVVILPGERAAKVPNIKALRELSNKFHPQMTLMEGKWAVENWEKFIAFVDEFNRLPLGGYGSGDEKGILQ
jgi:hypothetical protein